MPAAFRPTGRFSPIKGESTNGSEFIGSWNARHDSIFTKAVTSVPGLEHTTIPPSAHTWQADVETAHRLIEDEFYEVERLGEIEYFSPLKQEKFPSKSGLIQSLVQRGPKKQRQRPPNPMGNRIRKKSEPQPKTAHTTSGLPR